MSTSDPQQDTVLVFPEAQKIPDDLSQEMGVLKEDVKPVLPRKPKNPAVLKKKKKKPQIPRRKKKTEDPSKPVPLNLNNEVVRMRKEVRRVRTQVIRKLIKQIAQLKKRKGTEEDLERNRRRGARLLEEIHVMKRLKSDPVTKAALQKNLSFELVCKNPHATLTDRAMVRIATHPQFSKKIDTLKAAIKAFKDDRMAVVKGENEVAGKTEIQVKALPRLGDTKEVVGESKEVEESKGENDDEEECGMVVKSKSVMPYIPAGIPVNKTVIREISCIENTESPPENTESPPENTESPPENTESPPENTESPPENTESPPENTESPPENTESPPENTESPPENTESSIEKVASSPHSEMSETLKALIDNVTPFVIEAPQIAPLKKMESEQPTKLPAQKPVPSTQEIPGGTPAPQKTQNRTDSKSQRKDLRNKEEGQEEDNDGVESDLESSDDSSDDKEYFDDSTEERFQKQSSHSEESDSDDFFLGKVTKLKKKTRAKAAAPPGGGDGTGFVMGENPLLQPLDSLKPHQTEQDQLEDRLDRNSKANFTSVFCSSLSGSKKGRGRGRGGGNGTRLEGDRGRGGKDGSSRGRVSQDKGPGRGRGRGHSSFSSHQATEQALHPSWEASRKRKEQLTQMVAFQGKKIKFDDDD